MKHALRSLPLFSALLFAQSGPVHVTRIPAPAKALVFEVTLPASLDDVWAAFTTSQGLSTWLTPDAVVELRKGGEWTAHFPGGVTGGGTILDFTPKREIVMSAMAPPSFPNVRAARTTATWTFRSTGAKSTQLTLRQTGWKEGAEWDKAYEYLAGGNVELLATLLRRFENGPIDWVKEWGLPAK